MKSILLLSLKQCFQVHSEVSNLISMFPSWFYFLVMFPTIIIFFWSRKFKFFSEKFRENQGPWVNLRRNFLTFTQLWLNWDIFNHWRRVDGQKHTYTVSKCRLPEKWNISCFYHHLVWANHNHRCHHQLPNQRAWLLTNHKEASDPSGYHVNIVSSKKSSKLYFWIFRNTSKPMSKCVRSE